MPATLDGVDRLDDLIEKARHHKMSAKEVYEQRVSFIWGMQKLSEPGYTVEEIKAMLAERGYVDPDLCTQKGSDKMCDDPECPVWKGKLIQIDRGERW